MPGTLTPAVVGSALLRQAGLPDLYPGSHTFPGAAVFALLAIQVGVLLPDPTQVNSGNTCGEFLCGDGTVRTSAFLEAAGVFLYPGSSTFPSSDIFAIAIYL